MKIKATGLQRRGEYSLVEELCPRGFTTPWHVHRREDESFLMISGEATFFVGDRVIEARPGSFAFLPRGVPHSFRIDSDTARLFNLITPAGFEDCYFDLGEPARELVMPPPPEGLPDFRAIATVAAQYGCEILGPPPSAG